MGIDGADVRAPGETGWVPFRDVYEVDGEAVRDREERLSRLFLETPSTAWDQAFAIAEESSRFNLGSVRRTINSPTLALIFLARENQVRFEFENERTKDGLWEIRHHERESPTLIHGRDDTDQPVFGTFWINADDGRVLRSRVRTEDRDLRADITVTYQLDEELGLWLPTEMHEEYHTSGETIEGTATYGQFRQFNVQTTERIR